MYGAIERSRFRLDRLPKVDAVGENLRRGYSFFNVYDSLRSGYDARFESKS